MLTPARGKILCELLSRTRQLSSGIWLTDRIKQEKNDNVARCLGVGDPAVKDCYLCHDKKLCKSKCRDKGKLMPMVARRGDIIHFKQRFGQRFTYEDKKLISLKNEDLIAIEREGEIVAVGSMVICRLRYKEKMSGLYVPDNAKQNSGDFWGEVVSVGPDFPDKDLKRGDKVIYLRSEGYRFRAYEGDGRDEFLAIKERWCYGKE